MSGHSAAERDPAVDGRRVRWTQHRTDRRAGFVAAGATAIDTWGPGASAEQIAEAAGVSRTVLYRYFRDREDLRKAIADHLVQAVVASVLPQLDIGPRSTPRSVISAAIGVIVGWLDEHPNFYRFLRSRRDGGLDSVENTLADSVATLLQMLMISFGINSGKAEPSAYGIVGYVEASGGWWLEHRTMSRERVVEMICTGVWHLLDGTARELGIVLGYDDPLPAGALGGVVTEAMTGVMSGAGSGQEIG
jgi:AcrR family transcriptional regulator